MVTITSLSKDERAARVTLAATLEPDDAVTGRLITAVGTVETVRLAAGTGAFPKNVDAIEAGLWRNEVAPRMDARTVMQALSESDRLGLRILIPGDDDWPAALNDLGERTPTALWVRGATSFLTAPLSDRVTVTGARAATSYGEHVTGELASDLTHAERIIVAGGAYGIDAAAHRAALASGGQTVAVMVGGWIGSTRPATVSCWNESEASGFSPARCRLARHRPSGASSPVIASSAPSPVRPSSWKPATAPAPSTSPPAPRSSGDPWAQSPVRSPACPVPARTGSCAKASRPS